MIDEVLREKVNSRENKIQDAKDKLTALTNTKTEPLVNRIGKLIPPSTVAYTTNGKMMIRRPKKVVLERALCRTDSLEEGSMLINFKTQPETLPMDWLKIRRDSPTREP
jgi:hypothetical protein